MYFPTLTSGDLRHKVTIQKKSKAMDSEGVPIETWSDYISCYACIIPLGGREEFIASALQGDDPCMFRIRYNANIDNTMRFVYLGHNYRIININDVNTRHKELQITCNQEVQNG